MRDQELPADGLSIEPTCRIEFGPGRIAALPRLIDELGHHRVYLITDRGVRAAGILDRVLAVLAEAGLEHAVFDDVAANPTLSTVETGAAGLERFGSAAVVALGGGSPLDAAKAIALRAQPRLPGLPLVAIPTTAGTGAETNGFGVIEDPATRRKVYLGHASVRPAVAVLDPELTTGLPARITAATGLDALVHGIESLSSRGANPISAAYAAQAIALVARWLPVAHRDGTDLEARSRVMLGAHLAGQALTLSGLGLVHGLGHAITGHAGTPHGVALAAVLETVMEFNADTAGEAYADAARAMGAGGGAAAAIRCARDLADGLEIRSPLRDLGVRRDMLPSIAAAAAADPVTRNNPADAAEPQLHDLLQTTY
ncbi:iron-containing alcohol dehydrogenase family protein [Saccharopolyspora sp. 6V]|uniref:iron-containing alcohol dehydrogenase family protein n=1 Tax=Saccharopolyspora sp. 6V TaxID=2877239 RepID=UPI001CD2E85A|nr:iron-containing alcohol dehydrogenase [Saccharopolyspora sp. 6V]MCA1193987.1 iron-containing alcohol dehydrogenase [Saccharopolyspora sp. 6V]